ncbi:MAG: DUF6508 domain-containing protein [Methanobrevibacter sp.]|nr:DUF6508 domain-containing protein [Methanobrevibacter sp.]
MSLNKSNEELDKDKISIFLNEMEVKERNMLLKEIGDIEREIKRNHRKKMLIDKRIDILNKRRIKLSKELEGSEYEKVSMSQYILNNFSREELIKILDDFLQYKDYFENPPKEAYEVDDYDYSRCKKAYEIQHLLYKYEIYDTEYSIVKLPIMERKYKKEGLSRRLTPTEFSREKLTLDEILAILTWLHREERWCGGAFSRAIEDKTFYNLLKRMEEIRNEL